MSANDMLKIHAKTVNEYLSCVPVTYSVAANTPHEISCPITSYLSVTLNQSKSRNSEERIGDIGICCLVEFLATFSRYGCSGFKDMFLCFSRFIVNTVILCPQHHRTHEGCGSNGHVS